MRAPTPTHAPVPTYLITAASGIGAATARALAHTIPGGIRIFLVALEVEDCRSVCDELNASGAEADFLAGDLCESGFVQAAVERCLALYGRIDGLFSVAGASGRRFGDGPLHECTDEGWARTIEMNLTTQFRVCRETVCSMLRQRPDAHGQRGAILNMASILAIHPEPKQFNTIAYGSAKGGVIAMSRTMAAAYRSSGIRVNAVAPGLVRTRMSRRASSDPEIQAAMKIRQPLTQGLIPVEDVAATCVYLLTDASRPLTGQTIEVDAGWGLA